MMLDAVLNLISLAIGFICAVVWIYALVTDDGKGCKPNEDCKHCPFPCAEHNKKHNKKHNKNLEE